MELSIEKSGHPLVSIIMGAYNCEESISSCIESIIDQTYSNWEFIICDDCSTDGTLEVLKDYATKDQRIKIVRNEKNSKLAYSLNHCLKYARGEYVARMDDDDKSLPERLEKQVLFLNEHPEYAVVGSSVQLFDGEKITGVRKSREYPQKNNVLYGPPFMHPTIVMRKSVYDELGGYTVSSRTLRGQDWDLWFRFFANGYKGYNFQKPLLIYHESPDDYKKRTVKTGIMYTKTALFGYKLLGAPKYKYICALKPLLSAMIPHKVLLKYHSKKE